MIRAYDTARGGEMGKRVAVRADFTDALYIERAGLQSAAVWCHAATVVRNSKCGFGARTEGRFQSKLIIRSVSD